MAGSGDWHKTEIPYTQGLYEVSIICINKSFLFNILLAIFERSHSVIIIFVLP